MPSGWIKETFRMKNTLQLKEVKPTVFLTKSRGGLKQLVRVVVANKGASTPASLLVAWGKYSEEMLLGTLASGETTVEALISEIKQSARMDFALKVRGEVVDRKDFSWQSARHWVIHVVQSSHHDVGYTDLPSNVFALHNRNLDQAIDLAEETNRFPEEARFRIVIEQGWSLINFLRQARPERCRKMVRLLQSGRFEVTALFGNMTTEICGPETLIRSLYPSFDLKRRHGIPIVSAQHDDIPGISWGLCQVLCDADIKIFCPHIPEYYSWGGAAMNPSWDEKTFVPYAGFGLFWWEAPSGKRVLFWASYGAGGDFHPKMKSLSDKLQEVSDSGYPYATFRWRVTGGARDNPPYISDYAKTIKGWNEKWAYPRLICSTNAKFYADIIKEAPKTLPVYRGEMHGEDYPVGATSTAAATAVNRNNHVNLITAEKLALAAAVLTDYQYQQKTLTQAYEDTLYHDEHSWGHHFPCGPAAKASEMEKAVHAYRSAALAHDVNSKALARIADAIRLKEPGFHLVVFNPTTHCRTEVVRAPLREFDNCGSTMKKVLPENDPQGGYLKGVLLTDRWHSCPTPDLLAGKFDLIDATNNRKIPFQIIEIDSADTTVHYAAERLGIGFGGKRYGFFEVPLGLKKDLCFVAEDVPGCGYRTYRLAPRSDPERFKNSVKSSGECVENEFYRVTVDKKTGFINSLYDKNAGREMVDRKCSHPFGSLVVRNSEGKTESTLKAVRVRNVLDGPVCASIEITGSAHGHPAVKQTISLYRGINQIHLATRVLRGPGPLLDVHLAFPFLAARPVFRYEGVLAVMEPLSDYLAGSCADNIAVQNWVKVRDGDFNILWSSLDAPVASFARLWPGYVSPAHSCILNKDLKDPLLDKKDLDKGWVYSNIFNNNFGTNFSVSQSGDFLFRYVISSCAGDLSDGQAAVFGWQAVAGFEQIFTDRPRQGSLPASSSFVEIENPGLLLLTCKKAEDNNGYIFRFWNPGSKAIKSGVRLSVLRVRQANLTNLVEEDLGLRLKHGQAGFTVDAAPASLVNVRVIPFKKERRR